jgi:hypothetical protein
VTLSATLAATPDVTAVETVALVDDPAATDALFGFREIEKLLLGGLVTVSPYDDV